MGWIQLDPDSPYMQSIHPLLEAKEALGTDFGWLSGFPGEIGPHLNRLSQIIGSYLPEVDPVANQRYFAQAAMSIYTADQLQHLFVKQFHNKTETQLDELLKSFDLNNCLHNPILDQILEKRLNQPAA